MDTRDRALRADAARNHERIISAAVAAFQEIGPQVTLEEIAVRANVSVITLYRRFRTRDQLVRAVFGHVLTTELEPIVAVNTGDPWQDLVGALEAVTEVLARRQVIVSLAREFEAFAVESAHRFLSSIEPLLHRAIDAGVARPELLARDLTAITVMALATVHPGDPQGADRRRYLALLIDGLRPSPVTLPPPSSHDVPSSGSCRESSTAIRARDRQDGGEPAAKGIAQSPVSLPRSQVSPATD